jgi:hypothetical protein
MRARIRELEELSSPPGRAYSPDRDTARFVTAAGQGNLRLLVGMLRANRPWRLIVGLSRALVGALGASAFGLTSPGLWQIADGMGGSPGCSRWPSVPWPPSAALLSSPTGCGNAVPRPKHANRSR